MAEEQYINIIAQVFANMGHSTCSLATIISEISDKVTRKELLDHFAAGGEIGSDIQIPRTMLPEFSKRCVEEGIKFIECERDIESEFVTIMYKGPMSHRVNEIGDFEKKDGTRSEIGSDTKRIKTIAAEINEEYVNLKAKDYIEFIPANRPTFKEPWMIGGLDKDYAFALQEQLAEHFVESNVYYDEEKGKYAVEFEKSHLDRKSNEHLSAVEISVRETNFLINDDRVADYIEEQSLLNNQILAKIESGEMVGVVYEPQLIIKPDTMGLMDERDMVIKFDGTKATVHMKDPLNGMYIDETLDLKNEDDKLRIYKHLSTMKGRAFATLEEFKTIDKQRKMDRSDFSEFELSLIKDNYRRAQFEETISDFEKTVVKGEYKTVEDYKKDHPDDWRLAEYDKNIETMHKLFGYDEIKTDKDGNQTVTYHPGLKDTLFNQNDIMFSEYMQGRILDARVADSTETNSIMQEKEMEKSDPNYDRTRDVALQTRIEDSTVVVNHVAVITKNDTDTVNAVDKQRFEEIRRKSMERMAHMNMVMGSREEIVGDTHSYDKPISPRSLTAQEFALKHESYYEKDLDKIYENTRTWSEEEWARAQEQAEFEEAYRNNSDIDQDGIIEENEYDPFGASEPDIDDIEYNDDDIILEGVWGDEEDGPEHVH